MTLCLMMDVFCFILPKFYNPDTGLPLFKPFVMYLCIMKRPILSLKEMKGRGFPSFRHSLGQQLQKPHL